MDFSGLFKQAGRAAAKNSPAILTAIGVTGTLTTAYLAAKAGYKSVDVLREAEEAAREEFFADQTNDEGEIVEVEYQGLTKQEKFEAVWDLYIPAAGIAAMTVVAIVCANRVSDRRTAALASAYSVAQKSFEKYKAKTADKIGKNKEQAIRDEVAAEMVEENPHRGKIRISKHGGTLCMDMWSGRYFTGDIEQIRSAVNDFNARIINENYVSLNDFWELIGLDPTEGGSDIGWNTDRLLEIETPFATVDNERVLALGFKNPPIWKFDTIY